MPGGLWNVDYGVQSRWHQVGNCWVGERELWAWKGLCEKKKIVKFIPITIFWVIWKEVNSRAFDGIKDEMVKIRNRWFHLFSSLIWIMTYIGEKILRMS